jgi:hypothetical protein
MSGFCFTVTTLVLWLYIQPLWLLKTNIECSTTTPIGIEKCGGFCWERSSTISAKVYVKILKKLYLQFQNRHVGKWR